MTATKDVSDKTFTQDVINSKKPILVDFWASWCPPCVAVAPIVEELATSHADKIDVAKLNIEENQSTPADYRITSIPTFLLFEDGEVKKTIRGFKSKIQLEMELANYIR